MWGKVARLATCVAPGALILAAGCGLDTNGLEVAGDPGSDAGITVGSTTSGTADATVGDSAPAASNEDASLPAEDGGTANDGASVTDVAAIDSSPPPPTPDACAPTSDASALATMSAWPSPPAPKIDGDLSDWPCDGFIQVSGATAAYVKTPTHPLATDIQIRWDKQNIYVAAHVIDSTTATGYDPVNPYDNDSLEVYVSGDAALDGDYDPQTHQYVTDYKALTVDYGPTHQGELADTNPAHFTAATSLVPDGWDFEASIGWQAILLPNVAAGGFASGTNVALDFEINDGDGTTQLAALVFTLAPAQPTCTCIQANCCCGLTPDLPYCDSARIGRVTLQ